MWRPVMLSNHYVKISSKIMIELLNVETDNVIQYSIPSPIKEYDYKTGIKKKKKKKKKKKNRKKNKTKKKQKN